jgi:hypothetical protein
MAVRYGIPVSEFLYRHTSAEITELYAYFSLQSEPAVKQEDDPEEQARLIKQTLFKGQ